DAGMETVHGILDILLHALLVFPGKLYQYLEIVPERLEPVPLREDIDYPGFFGLDVPGLVRVRPEIGVGKLFFQLGQSFFPFGDFKENLGWW
ncbi:MAG TPA: hypothetical protein PK600_07995, partial [Deltaproteobacteria bacterium]|nr:hypothetical protein [Deltaproteobacteria bacterium]